QVRLEQEKVRAQLARLLGPHGSRPSPLRVQRQRQQEEQRQQQQQHHQQPQQQHHHGQHANGQQQEARQQEEEEELAAGDVMPEDAGRGCGGLLPLQPLPRALFVVPRNTPGLTRTAAGAAGAGAAAAAGPAAAEPAAGAGAAAGRPSMPPFRTTTG
ncbi:hypothetical protein Agub_g791, partial [Astrephomene gubernaculifera]